MARPSWYGIGRVLKNDQPMSTVTKHIHPTLCLVLLVWWGQPGWAPRHFDAQMRAGWLAVLGANEQQHFLLPGESLAGSVLYAVVSIYSPVSSPLAPERRRFVFTKKVWIKLFTGKPALLEGFWSGIGSRNLVSNSNSSSGSGSAQRQ